jgi:hypothetical protein
MFLAYGSHAGKFFDPRFVDKKVRLIEEWSERAKKDFVTAGLALFHRCKVYGREDRRKHWPPGNMTNRELLELSTKTKESMFLPWVEQIDLQQGLWLAMAKFFGRFKKGKIRYVVVDFEDPVGVSQGEWCYRVKYDLAKYYAHAYPIGASEDKSLPSVALSEFGLRLRGRH